MEFPPLQFNPLPLSAGQEEQSLLIIKRDLLSTLSKSPFFVRPVAIKKDIERYSDCYHVDDITVESQMKIMDESRFPKETRGQKRKIIKKITKIKKSRKSGDTVDVEKTLKDLESQETNEDDEDAEEEEEAEENEELLADEDEFEAEIDEGTDYNANYFDNGEDYIDDEDDKLDEGPTF